MRVPGFVGPAYKARASMLECQRCVNLYPEVDETGIGKDGSVAALIGTPGLNLVATLGGGPVRGMYLASTGKLYVCSGSNVYTLSSDGTAYRVGTIGSSAGPVSFADNGTYLALVDGSSTGYYVNFNNGIVSTIIDEDFFGGNTVAVVDEYFVFNKPRSKFFYILRPGSTDFDALDFASAEANPDKLLGIVQSRQQLWLFGSNSIEIFYNSGDPEFPFDRVSGGVINIGTLAMATVEVIDNSLIWLGKEERGGGAVYITQAYQPVRVSTHAIEMILQSAATLSDCTAYAYQQEGHYFYVLNVPSADTSLVYDITTKQWHERRYTSPDTGELLRHRGDCHAYAFGKHYVGDFENGNVYELDLDTYTDNGDVITRLRASPHMASEAKRVFYSEFQLDIEVGIGLDGIAQGTDPQAMLEWSDDGGKTWSNEHWRTIGPLGNYKTRVRWQRLGAARDRVWRVKVTDPIKIAIIGAYVTPTQGAN